MYTPSEQTYIKIKVKKISCINCISTKKYKNIWYNHMKFINTYIHVINYAVNVLTKICK